MIRKDVLTQNEIYHVYNRGIEKKQIFSDKRDYQHAVNILNYYRFDNIKLRYSELSRGKSNIFTETIDKLSIENKRRIDILAYCLMPNHFHLLVRQLTDTGISKFMADFQNSYTRHYNVKHERIGSLFQGSFKSIYVKNNEYLLHLSRYIHLNPINSFIIKQEQLTSYPWSSFAEYNSGKNVMCEQDTILSNFSSPKEYADFVLDYVDYTHSLGMITRLTFNEY